MKKVTGIGGVFFKARDPQILRDWYGKHLGIPNMSKYGGLFEWKDQDDPDSYGHTVWSPMEEKTTYFDPGNSRLMINYRVENLLVMLEQLKEEGVQVVGKVEEYNYGKFGWILDPDGNKIELWEPNDKVFREVNNLD